MTTDLAPSALDVGATLTRLGAAITSASLPADRVSVTGESAGSSVYVTTSDEAAVRIWADYLGSAGSVQHNPTSATSGYWSALGYLHGVEIFVSSP